MSFKIFRPTIGSILLATLCTFAAQAVANEPATHQRQTKTVGSQRTKTNRSTVWNRLYKAWPIKRNRNTASPIIVADGVPQRSVGRVRLTADRPPEPQALASGLRGRTTSTPGPPASAVGSPEINAVYPPRLVIQLPDEDSGNTNHESSTKDASTNDSQEDDAESNTESVADESDGKASETKKDAPSHSSGSLNSLFTPLESIDISRAARQIADPKSQISFPINHAVRFVGATRVDVSHGPSFTRLAQIEVQPHHHPLYFEDRFAERCGAGQGCLTTLSSAAHFFGRIPMLPYLMTAQPPKTCVPATTDCPPRHGYLDDPKFETIHGGPVVAQALAVTALVFLFP